MPLDPRPEDRAAGANRPLLAIAVTHPMTADLLLRGQLGYLRRQGFALHLISSPGAQLDRVAAREGVEHTVLPMRRDMSPLADLIALVRYLRLFRKLRPDILSAGTPKAGLLATLGARLAGVATRIYTVRGLRSETARGWRAALLRFAERTAAASATHVVCVSPSLAAEYASRGFAPRNRIRVLGSGSSNGVDTERFSPPGAEDRARARDRLRIPADALVVGFVGRLVRDKGVEDLAAAFQALFREYPDVYLLLAGEFEDGDAVSRRVRTELEEHPRVAVLGFVEDPVAAYHAMDVLVLPSSREGFPNAVLEGSACALPVVAYDATGSRDAVAPGTTGQLAELGNPDALARALGTYLDDPALRAAHGRAGRKRVLDHFRNETVWATWADLYRELLDTSDLATDQVRTS